MAYTISEPQAGFLPLNQTDSGFIPPNNANTGSTTTVPTLPSKAGMIINGTDPTYGGAEFILLKGVASTVVGSVVTYNLSDFTTTLAASAVTVPMPIAVAMSANAATTTWGWYQISGVAIAAKGGAAPTTGAAVAVSTTGVVGAAATGSNVIQGAQYAAAASTAASTVAILINRPHLEDVLA